MRARFILVLAGVLSLSASVMAQPPPDSPPGSSDEQTKLLLEDTAIAMCGWFQLTAGQTVGHELEISIVRDKEFKRDERVNTIISIDQEKQTAWVWEQQRVILQQTPNPWCLSVVYQIKKSISDPAKEQEARTD